jgi:hypothetical protein
VVKTGSIACSVLVALALVAGSACSRQAASSSAAAASASAGSPAAQPPTAGAPATPPGPNAEQGVETVTGEVVETMDAANYTYMRLKTPKGEVWAATGQTTVKVGAKVVVPLETEMKNFHSPSLKRDFPVIYFVSQITREGQSVAPSMALGHGANGMPAPAQVKVEPIAPPAGGSSIADIWAKRTALVGKTVTVNGKVVKFNGGILGLNWLHVQDGSGTAADGTNDLTITTDGSAKVGDVITVTGKVVIDKDLGSGYVYKVLLEGAKIK